MNPSRRVEIDQNIQNTTELNSLTTLSDFTKRTELKWIELHWHISVQFKSVQYCRFVHAFNASSGAKKKQTKFRWFLSVAMCRNRKMIPRVVEGMKNEGVDNETSM